MGKNGSRHGRCWIILTFLQDSSQETLCFSSRFEKQARCIPVQQSVTRCFARQLTQKLPSSRPLAEITTLQTHGYNATVFGQNSLSIGFYSRMSSTSLYLFVPHLKFSTSGNEFARKVESKFTLQSYNSHLVYGAFALFVLQ